MPVYTQFITKYLFHFEINEIRSTIEHTEVEVCFFTVPVCGCYSALNQISKIRS